MRHRWMSYVTLLFTLLFPLLGAVWARSYIHDDSLFRVGQGRAMLLSCVRGEVALWEGPTRDNGPIRYVHESSDTGLALRASEMLAGDVGARHYWLAGFGCGLTYSLAPRELGPVRCVAIPLWFLTLFAAAWPGRAVLNHVRRNQALAAAERSCCRRCGAQLGAGETRCQACMFPAFIRHGWVA